jgi:hypothetical protein
MKLTHILTLFILISLLLPQGAINSQTKFKKWKKQDHSNPCKFDELYNSLNTLYENGVRDEAASPDFLRTIKSILNRYTPSPALPTNGLVAYYPFNANANDESGNGHDGRIAGASMVTDRFGNPNSAFSFNGTSDYIKVMNSENLDFKPKGFTLAAWVNYDNNLSDVVVLSKHRYSYGTGYVLGVEKNQAKVFLDQYGHLATTETYSDSQWHFIVCTYDGTTLILSVDGIQKGNQKVAYNRTNTSKLCIGASENNSGGINGYYSGLIDDVRIYNRALSESEIQILYHEGGW